MRIQDGKGTILQKARLSAGSALGILACVTGCQPKGTAEVLA